MEGGLVLLPLPGGRDARDRGARDGGRPLGGDEQTGEYGPEVLAELREFHDSRFGRFSELLQTSFDEALARVPDGSVDLLHIDGFHRYEAVKHDLESWSTCAPTASTPKAVPVRKTRSSGTRSRPPPTPATRRSRRREPTCHA